MIALATQADLPDWEVDDRFLRQALADRGVVFEEPVWDDPTVDWGRYEAVLIRTTWDYAAKRDAFVAWAERVAGVTRLFNPPDIIRWNTDKHYLRDLEAAGVPIAPTEWLEPGSTASIAEIVERRGWTRGFVKPIFGQTARETLRFDVDSAGIATAQAHIERLLPHEGLMVQPYLSAVEVHGEHSAITFGGELAQVVQKVPVPGDYRVMDDFGGTDRSAEMDASGLEVCECAIRAVPSSEPLLYARVDLLRDDSGGWVLTELELVEPSLFFRHAPESAGMLANALIGRL